MHSRPEIKLSIAIGFELISIELSHVIAIISYCLLILESHWVSTHHRHLLLLHWEPSSKLRLSSILILVHAISCHHIIGVELHHVRIHHLISRHV